MSGLEGCSISEDDFCKLIDIDPVEKFCEALGINGDPNDPRKKLITIYHPFSIYNLFIDMGADHETARHNAAKRRETLMELKGVLKKYSL